MLKISDHTESTLNYFVASTLSTFVAYLNDHNRFECHHHALLHFP
ncbi:hypothetical protein T07_3934 [Trichinella nelsoni]|uniref:Uncharacterized protein n=1 Tax=Trichinella nelsoni TaxID=6336 RepID=A0A0V0RAJ6_9BILA|nr:hypothetical protein T07_3934 [Trichinella nelsoni]